MDTEVKPTKASERQRKNHQWRFLFSSRRKNFALPPSNREAPYLLMRGDEGIARLLYIGAGIHLEKKI